MRYPAEETAKRHELLLQRASEMFRERGFENVSVAEVMQAAGLTHGAFYSHFESKTDLMQAAMERALEKSRTGIETTFKTAAGRDQYLDSYLAIEHRDNLAGGCAMSALSGELRREPDLQEMFARKLDEIINATGDARADAILTIATLVGAMTLARAVGDTSFSQEILRAVRAGMKRQGAAAARRR